MSSSLKISVEAEPLASDMAMIENAIHRYNMTLMQDWNFSQVAVFLRDDTGSIQGGALGGIWGAWLHLNFLWVSEAQRSQGYGSRLLETVEHEARQSGCLGVFMETHSFQARPFYNHHGYVVAGEIIDYPPGHTYYLLQKRFTPAVPPSETPV